MFNCQLSIINYQLFSPAPLHPCTPSTAMLAFLEPEELPEELPVDLPVDLRKDLLEGLRELGVEPLIV